MKIHDFSALTKSLGKNKYLLLFLVLALVLMLLPSGRDKEKDTVQSQGSELESSGIPLDTESARLSEFLSLMEGVGEARVLLSAEGAVILCEGADNSSVRLYVTNAVSVYTGLGSDKIRIIKLK
ncbi:MAG: hypothetical protein E7420_00930 [Ruminococcaceae bacterium]|nr:hypothetical protein [Oscillospiraceae bacterium]